MHNFGGNVIQIVSHTPLKCTKRSEKIQIHRNRYKHNVLASLAFIFLKCIVVDRNDVEILCVVLYHQAHQESTCTVTLLNSIRLQWATCYAMHLSSDALATLQWNHTFHDNALQFFSAAHVPGHVVAAVFKAFFLVRFLELDLLWVWLVNIAHNFHCQIMAVKNMDHLKIFRGRF